MKNTATATITGASLVTRHVEAGRSNFAQLTVEVPASELTTNLKLAVKSGMTCSVPPAVMEHILAAGDRGAPH